jgi:hypothetical protein
MVSVDNIELLKKDIFDNIGLKKWKKKEVPVQIFGINRDEIDLFMFFMLYFLLSFRLAGANADKLLQKLFTLFPRMNNINQIHSFLKKFPSNEAFWKMYLPEYKVKHKNYLSEFVEYHRLELVNYDGTNDLERFYSWIETVDISSMERYGIGYSVHAVQYIRRLFGFNVITINNNIEDYIEAVFDRKFKKNSIVYIFELIKAETNCDLWYVSDKIEAIFLKIEKERRAERKVSNQNLKSIQYEMMAKAKEIIPTYRWKELNSRSYPNRDEKIKKILEYAGLDYRKYWDF